MTDPITRSHDAARLLEDPLFIEAVAAVDTAIIAELRGKPTANDPELLMALRTLAKVKNWIRGQMETGKVELHERDNAKPPKPMSQMRYSDARKGNW